MEKVKLSFKELWKAFTEPDLTYNSEGENLDIREVVKNDTTISEDEKASILKEIEKEKENNKKLASHLFKESLQVESQKAVDKWKKKNSKVPENVLSDKGKKEIAEKAAKKAYQDMEIDR